MWNSFIPYLLGGLVASYFFYRLPTSSIISSNTVSHSSHLKSTPPSCNKPFTRPANPKQISKLEWSVASSTSQMSASDVYLDLGWLPWPDTTDPKSHNIDYKCVDWSNPSYPNGVWNWQECQNLYNPLFQNLIASGTKRIFWAFAQLSDLENLMNTTSTSVTPHDAIQIDNMAYTFTVEGSNPWPSGQRVTLFGLFIQLAAQQGLKNILSFGGYYAGTDTTSISWQFPPGVSPSTLANQMVGWAKANKIDGFDFDIEGDVAMKVSTQTSLFMNGADNVACFFNTLSQLIGEESMILTAAMDSCYAQAYGSDYTWIIPYFQQINVMLYWDSNGPQFVAPIYIDSWLSYPEIAGHAELISPSFQAGVWYNNPSQSCGGGCTGGTCTSPPSNIENCGCTNCLGAYSCSPGPNCPDVSTASNGTAAFLIYQNAVQNLATTPSLTLSNFGPAVWWLDDPGQMLYSGNAEATVLNDFWKASQGNLPPPTNPCSTSHPLAPSPASYWQPHPSHHQQQSQPQQHPQHSYNHPFVSGKQQQQQQQQPKIGPKTGSKQQRQQQRQASKSTTTPINRRVQEREVTKIQHIDVFGRLF